MPGKPHTKNPDAMTISGLHGRKFFQHFFKPSKSAIKDLYNGDALFYHAPQFHHLLRIERKRASRSKKPFLLALIDFSALEPGKHHGYLLEKMKEIIIACTRETDIHGWYENDRIMGIIFTEMTRIDKKVIDNIFSKIRSTMGEHFTKEWTDKIVIYPHVFGALEKNEIKAL